MKKLMTILFIFILMVIFAALCPTQANAATVIESGTCGTDLVWELDDTGNLTISGTGKMKNYGYTLFDDYYFDAPWASVASSIIKVVIADGVTGIGSFAFDNCTALTDVTIGNSVTYIAESAFDNCTGLTDIVIPDSVINIHHRAFRNCTSLTGVSIGSGVSNIAWDVFEGCADLSSIQVDRGNAVYHSAGNCLIKTESKTVVVGCKNSIIPADGSVTGIGRNAFWGRNGLVEITIPATVTDIGDYAFYGCTDLETAYYKDSQKAWENVSIGTENAPLLNARIVFTPAIYTVAFKNWDGTVISSNTYYYGDPVTAPTNPIRPADNTCTYTFTGWDKTIAVCTGNAVYTATYMPTYIDYTVTFVNWDDAVISSDTYHYGAPVTVPANPARPADNAYTYTFIGWDKTVTMCAGDTVYRAQYSAEAIPAEPIAPTDPTEPSTDSATEPSEPTTTTVEPQLPDASEKDSHLTEMLIFGAVCLVAGLSSGILISRKKR